MKYTVELTENGITETLELNGIIYKKEWTRLENGLLQCSQKDFSEQMRVNGHDGDLIERVAEVFDSFLAGDVDDIADLDDEEHFHFDNEEEKDVYFKSSLRHEIIHAFLNESGLKDNFEHVPRMGHEETMVDWIANQFPKIADVYEKLGIL